MLRQRNISISNPDDYRRIGVFPTMNLPTVPIAIIPIPITSSANDIKRVGLNL
jgi:hypothetical protein